MAPYRLLAGFLVLGLLTLNACTPEPAPGRIKVKWRLGAGVACDNENANIDTIRVKIMDPGETEVMSETFRCSAGEGEIDRVPIGTYNVVFEGGKGDDFEFAAFKGVANTVIVDEGTTVELDEVALAKVPESENPGGLQITWSFASGGLCGGNGVANVRLIIWGDQVYLEHDEIYPCDIPKPGYVKLKLAPGSYSVDAEALDEQGVVTHRATADAEEVLMNEVTKVDLSLEEI